MAVVKLLAKTNISAKSKFLFTPKYIIWNGSGVDNNWSTSSNWDVIRLPVSFDILQFAGTTRLEPFNDLTIDTPFNGITFNSGAGPFALAGNRFVLDSDSITNNSSNTQTINTDIVLGSSAGTINCATSAINLNGNISGSGSLQKIGSSTLSLSGNNSYTGNTYISAGNIDVLNSNPFGTGSVYLSSQSGVLIRIPTTATPINTIINNSINLNGQKVEGGISIRADKSTTINGLLTLGPENLTNSIYIDNNATVTFNGGISALPTMGRLFRILGNSGSAKTGTLVLSSNPIIIDSATASGIYADRASVNIVVAVSGNKFSAIRLGTTLRTDVPLAINNDFVTLGFPRLGSLLLPGIIDLNGNDQIFNRLNITTGTPFNDVIGNNIFNNSSTFANLTANNTGGSSTYTGSISGNINLTKIGSQTLTLSGSTALGIGPRYTGFTAISAGSLINYALLSNPSNKVSLATFTPSTLSATFATQPLIGETFLVFGGRTINSYPFVTSNISSPLTAQYVNANSMLEALGPFRWTGGGSNNNWSTGANWTSNRAPLSTDTLTFFGSTRVAPFNDTTTNSPFSGIIFAGGSSAFTLSGNDFAVTWDIINNSLVTQQINNNVILSATNVNVNAKLANILLTGNINGSGSLTKLGASTLSISGSNNTYTGNTFISSGQISVLNNNPFGTGSVYCSGQSGAFFVSPNAAPTNTIINNPIFIDGERPNFGYNIQAQKSATFNGLITVGPNSRTNRLNVQNGATVTINGGLSGTSGMSGLVTMNGNGTFILSSVPIIFDNTNATPIYSDSGIETVIIAVSGNKFNNIRTGANLRTDVPFAINNDTMFLGFVPGTFNRSGRINLNGNDQVFRNIQAGSVTFANISGNNIFNNSSTFANLTANNTAGTTYTGSISGNINLIKTGSNTLNLSGSTTLGVGPRYTGFTAISAGTLINYALSSNPSDKVNFAQFTNAALTVNFTTPPIVGDAFILLPGRTINSYPAVTLQNASGRTASYNSTTSTLSVIT